MAHTLQDPAAAAARTQKGASREQLARGLMRSIPSPYPPRHKRRQTPFQLQPVLAAAGLREWVALRAVAPARWPGPLRLAPGARPYHGPIMGESARPPRPPAATPSCCQKNFVVKVFINHPPPLNSERFQLKCDTPETKELPGGEEEEREGISLKFNK